MIQDTDTLNQETEPQDTTTREVSSEEIITPENVSSPEVSFLVAKVEKLERLVADYQNAQKRADAEKASMYDFTLEKITKKLLPVLDNLERVLQNTPKEQQDTPVYAAVTAAVTLMTKELQGLGITSFSSLDTPVNPDMHEVLSQAPGPEGVVVLEFEKGYQLQGKVIRHAKVIAGNGVLSSDVV